MPRPKMKRCQHDARSSVAHRRKSTGGHPLCLGRASDSDTGEQASNTSSAPALTGTDRKFTAMTTFAILNVDTGNFYSESPALKNEAKRIGGRWGNSSILPTFARRYARHIDAIRRSQKLSNQTGCVCAVVALSEPSCR
jgi:hypothetical protein